MEASTQSAGCEECESKVRDNIKAKAGRSVKDCSALDLRLITPFRNQFVLSPNPCPYRLRLPLIEGSAFPERKDCGGKMRNGYEGGEYCDIDSA